MSLQMTLNLIHKSTGSPESEDGATPFDLQDGQMVDLSGQAAHHANLSPRLAREAGLLTSGTYGRRSFGTFGSVNLTHFLASRLALKQVWPGSMLWRLTWKHRVTTSGRLIYALRGSARFTFGKDFTSWPTPRTLEIAEEWEDYLQRMASSKHTKNKGKTRPGNVATAALLATWKTPQAMDSQGKGRKGRLKKDGNRDPQKMGSYRMDLKDEAVMVSWRSPNAHPSGIKTERLVVTKDGDPWVPGQRAYDKETGRHAQVSLEQEAIATSGEMPNGSNVQTESKGQLNPEFSLWLMGFPTEWASCGERVTLSSRK